MLPGTKKLFPTDYNKFKETMIALAAEEELPVTLRLEDVEDYSLKDIQDLFYEFNRETLLDITGTLYFCEECGRLHFLMEVDYPETKENNMIQ